MSIWHDTSVIVFKAFIFITPVLLLIATSRADSQTRQNPLHTLDLEEQKGSSNANYKDVITHVNENKDYTLQSTYNNEENTSEDDTISVEGLDEDEETLELSSEEYEDGYFDFDSNVHELPHCDAEALENER